jgi:hypothetical protein
LFRRLPPHSSRHRDVEEQDVGAKLPGVLQRLCSGSRFGDNRESGLGFYESAQTLSHDSVVVCNDDPNLTLLTWGCSRGHAAISVQLFGSATTTVWHNHPGCTIVEQ